MVAPHLESEQIIATLIELTVPCVEAIRIQNYCAEDYIWCDKAFQFSPFEGTISIARQSSFGNSSVSATLGNTSAKYDSLRPIRDLLRQNDGLRHAQVHIFQIWPDRPDAPPIAERVQVLSSSLSYASALLNLRSPIEAINAQVPSVLLSQQIAPELPQTASGRF